MGSAHSVPLLQKAGVNEVIKIIPDVYLYQDSEDNEEIDVDALVLALRKLSCIFVEKKHLNQNFIDAVLNPKHKNFDNQFIAVALWITQHDSYVRITPYELFSLIKYVELYRPFKRKKLSAIGAEELQLTYPNKDCIAAFTGKIRAQEAKILSFGKCARFLPRDNTVRVRANSADVLSSVDLEEYYDI